MSPMSFRLLIVDDNPMNRDLLVRHLRRLQYQTVEASDGHLALEILQKETFDLVLLDIMMPTLDGQEVLKRMKADARLRHVPVIMISAMDSLETVVRCIELGAEDYLTKPFNPVLLRARIGASLEKKRLRDLELECLRQVEEEKQKSDHLLRVLLPDRIADELKLARTVTPRRHEHVAVLFCDVVGFTPFCEHHSPEVVVSHLQEMVAEFERITHDCHLEKIKTIGDAFMATAGLLHPVENPVAQCVQAALGMLAALRHLPSRWNVRIGVHLGPVVAGIIGHRRFSFDIWGDTVNTAARIASHGPPGHVSLSKEAWMSISSMYPASSLGPIPIKGKKDLEIYVISEVAVPAHVSSRSG